MCKLLQTFMKKNAKEEDKYDFPQSLIKDIHDSDCSPDSYDDCITLKLKSRLLVNYDYKEGRKNDEGIREKLS